MAVEVKNWRNTEYIVQHNFSTNGEGNNLHTGIEGVTKSFFDEIDQTSEKISQGLPETSPLLPFSDN